MLVILDLDGTLFRGDQPLPNAVETVAELRRRGHQIRYLTNNSSQTRSTFIQKLTRMGFECSDHEVASSAIGTGKYLVQEGLRSAFVVGEPGLVQTLREFRVTVPNALENGLAVPQPEGATSVDAVVVGICRHFDYPLMNSAMQHLLRGARFVATNTDATYPLEEGRLILGAGSIVAAVKTCSGVEPFVVGKPNPFLIQMLMEEAGVGPDQTLVVGDRLDTDIACGEAAGCRTHLVLTGVETRAPEGQSSSADLSGLLELL